MKFAVSSLNRQDGDSHRINQDHCRYVLIHIHAILNDVVFLIVSIIHIQYRHLENTRSMKWKNDYYYFDVYPFSFYNLYINVYMCIFMHSQFFITNITVCIYFLKTIKHSHFPYSFQQSPKH